MKYSSLGWTAVMAAFAVSMAVTPAAAKGNSAKPKQPTVRVTSAKAKPVTVAKAGPPATAGAKAKTPTPKVKVASTSGAKAKASGSPTLSSKPALTSSDAKPTTSSTPALTSSDPKPTTSSNPPTGTLNKAQQLLLKNDNLRMKMQERLGGMDPILAASDFRNLGQFVAAVNASFNDPSIQFLALKALMTGDPAMSLGQAKQQLKGTATATSLTSVTNPTDQR